MGTEHTMFRSAKDSAEEAERLIARFNKRDVNYEFTRDDICEQDKNQQHKCHTDNEYGEDIVMCPKCGTKFELEDK